MCDLGIVCKTFEEAFEQDRLTVYFGTKLPYQIFTQQLKEYTRTHSAHYALQTISIPHRGQRRRVEYSALSRSSFLTR